MQVQALPSSCTVERQCSVYRFECTDFMKTFDKCVPNDGKRTVVVMFLITSALRMLSPTLRPRWQNGSLTVVTLGGYHFEDHVFGIALGRRSFVFRYQQREGAVELVC